MQSTPASSRTTCRSSPRPMKAAATRSVFGRSSVSPNPTTSASSSLSWPRMTPAGSPATPFEWTVVRSFERNEESMIRSVSIHEFGGPEVLRIEEVEVEKPGEGEVRIRIRAIGINRTEITLRSGRSPAKPSLPSKIGWEAAGEIEAVGAEVNGFAIGDRVALVPAYAASRYGLYGESSLAPARSPVKIPDAVSFEQAAATWAAYGTAWAGLMALCRVADGQTVLL